MSKDKYQGSTESISDRVRNELTQEDAERVDYWAPLAGLIMEAIGTRADNGLSQKDVAKRMSTTQSVVSRFENMGRKPNYDFLVRLSTALGGTLRISLDGKNTISVPNEIRSTVDEIVDSAGCDRAGLLQRALVVGLSQITAERRDVEAWGRRVEDTARSGLMVAGSHLEYPFTDLFEIDSTVFRSKTQYRVPVSASADSGYSASTQIETAASE